MKKALAVLCMIALLALLLGGIGYVLLFMEDEPSPAPSSRVPSDQPRLNVKQKAETPADVLDALGYEIGANRDTVGWLDVPGTDINNSVLQSHDNDFYLRRNERKQYEVYGCYFADYECSVGNRDVLSPNTIIYGHSSPGDDPDGRRFSQLFRFTDPDFAAKTPVIHFSTLDDFMVWQVFAVFYTDIGFNYISSDPSDGITAMAAQAMEKSLYNYGVEIGPDDHILALSTCTEKYGDSNHRFVVMARLLPKDEEIPATAQFTLRPEAES